MLFSFQNMSNSHNHCKNNPRKRSITCTFHANTPGITLYPGRKLGRQADHPLSSLELQCKAERETHLPQVHWCVLRRTPLTSPPWATKGCQKIVRWYQRTWSLLLGFFVSLIAKFSKRLKGRFRTANKNKPKARKLEMSATA